MAVMDVRQGLAPGDVGAIVELHGRLYATEHGLDHRFEAGVARGLGALVLGGFPRAHEGAWIADDGGRVRGSILLSDEGDGLGRVRFFVLEPGTRGQGLGHRMLDALLAHARSGPYDRLELETFSALRAAAHLYRSEGFAVVSTEVHDRWGPSIEMQRYELAL
jgi:ribosomal protein S18 acetylase RimI-like enzyme